MKTKLLFALLILCKSLSSQSDGYKITGLVKVAETQHTLSDVYLYIIETNEFAITNGKGEFELLVQNPGAYHLKTSNIGFEDRTLELDLNKQQTVNLNIQLKESINDLPLVNINAQNGTGGFLGTLDLSGSAHYISKKELSSLNTTNIHDILRNIPGLQIQEEDGFGLRPNIGIRGTGSERSSKITIMEDGVLAAPAPYAAPSAYYFPTSGRMESIEVLKGASQIKYGPFSTGGSINLISTAVPSELRGIVKFGAGNFNTKQLTASIGDKRKQFSYLIEGFQHQSDGFKKITGTNNDFGFNKKDLLLKLKWESDQKSKIYQSLEFKYAGSNENSQETYLGLTKDDFDANPNQRYLGSQEDNITTKQRQLTLHYLVQPFRNTYFQSTFYNNTFFRNWYKLDKVETESGTKTSISNILDDPDDYLSEFELINGRNSLSNEALHVKANNRNYFSRGVQSKLSYINKKHQLDIGFRVHQDQMDRFQWVDEYQMKDRRMILSQIGTPGTESNRIESAFAISTFIKHEWSFNKFTLDWGFRNEVINASRDDFGKEDPERDGNQLNIRTNSINIIIPGAVLKYKINDQSQLFTGIHRGFSPPGSQPEVSPELSTNVELGYQIQARKLYGSAVVFRNAYSNLVGADLASSAGTGSGDLYNGGASLAQGMELAVSYRYFINNNIHLPISAQYTYTNTKFLNDFESNFEPWKTVSYGDMLPYISPQTFNARIGMNHKLFSITWSSNFRDAMLTEAALFERNGENVISSRWIFNIDCAFRFRKSTELSFAIHNIANTSYAVAARPAGLRPGMPRNFLISIRNRF